MLRFGWNTFCGACMGLVLGVLIGGMLGYFSIHAKYSDVPNGNPTETEFFRFLVSGSSVFFAMVSAAIGGVFGSLIGAFLGSIAGVLLRVKDANSRKSKSSKGLPVLAEQNDPPKLHDGREGKI